LQEVIECFDLGVLEYWSETIADLGLRIPIGINTRISVFIIQSEVRNLKPEMKLLQYSNTPVLQKLSPHDGYFFGAMNRELKPAA